MISTLTGGAETMTAKKKCKNGISVSVKNPDEFQDI